MSHARKQKGGCRGSKKGVGLSNTKQESWGKTGHLTVFVFDLSVAVAHVEDVL